MFNSHSTSKNQNYKSSHYITSIKLSHHAISIIVPNSHTIHQNYLIRLRHLVRPHTYISTQNKFSDNLKPSIFTQNHPSQFQKPLAKSNNLRTLLELLSNHISHDHKLYPISPSPKLPKSLVTSI